MQDQFKARPIRSPFYGLHVLRSISVFVVLLIAYNTSNAQKNGDRKWHISNVGLRFQSTLQYIPDLSYPKMIALTDNQAPWDVDMAGYSTHGTFEYFSHSIGAYAAFSKSISSSFSHYAELGIDFHSNSEFLVDYYRGDIYGDHQIYGWCIVQDGFNSHFRYAIMYQRNFLQVRVGPTLSYGSSFNERLLLLLEDRGSTPSFDDRYFGRVASISSWRAYLDTQVALNVYKGFMVVAQGKWGLGKINALNSDVKNSTSFGGGIEYAF